MKTYKYGMRLRGFGPGCQPMNGFVCRSSDSLYLDVIEYDRELTNEEVEHFSLDPLFAAPVDPELVASVVPGVYVVACGTMDLVCSVSKEGPAQVHCSDHSFRFADIEAVYKLEGDDYTCVWERVR